MHIEIALFRNLIFIPFVLCISIVIMILPDSADAVEKAPTDPIEIQSGRISGVLLRGKIRAYKGIPFAAPPVGNLRWKPPLPVAPWEGVLPCTEYGPACIQPKSLSAFGRYDKQSEDCLYLNIWSPAESADDKLPVMLWIHGGAFVIGSASDDAYDGRDLAEHGVIVVTTNYRLGPFGFFAHPLLSKESPHNVSGNYGLLDQIAVLKWIRDNISKFGGDPGRVTVFGQSAGGRSVAHLMVSPLSKGLFHRGIMESSSIYRPLQHLKQSWYGRPSMESVGKRISKRLGCEQSSDVLRALRSKTPEEINEAADPTLPGVSFERQSEGNVFEPIAEGWVIPGDPSDLFDAGKQHDVPIICGSNADEGSLFIRKIRFLNRWTYGKIIGAAFPEFKREVIKRYPYRNKQQARKALNTISGAMNCLCPMRRVARNMKKVGSDAWLYYFSYVRSDIMGQKYGAWHGSEIRFVFDSLDRGRTLVENKDRKLADIVSGYWVQFAKTGNPNAPGLSEWLPYHSTCNSYLELGDRIRNRCEAENPVCDLFERIEAYQRKNR